MNSVFRIVPLRFRALAKQISFFVLGTVLTVFYAQLVHAQTPAGSTIRTAYSAETIIAAVVGAVITIFFFRGMYLVLTYASQTYGLGDEDEDLSDTSRENNTLLYGAFVWVIGSAIVIASYGFGRGFLYLGPLICLLGPIVPIIAMERDLKRYRRALADRSARPFASSNESEFIHKP
jgi:hypothetical protein